MYKIDPFWKDNFFSNKNTLDPRQDSESILEAVLKFIPRKKNLQILELGLGTGCLLFSLLRELPYSFGFGLEKSIEAIKNTQKNNFFPQRCKIIHGKWQNLRKIFPNFNFDIIISNPPYVRSLDIPNLDENVRKFDPTMALSGGHNGLYCYFQIFSALQDTIKTNTLLFLEIGYGQTRDVKKIFQNEYKLIHIEKDLRGIERCLVLQKI